MTAGALLLASVAGAQTVADERQALSIAKAQSAQANLRAQQLEIRAAAERSAADRARAQTVAVGARIQSAEADISAAEARIRLIEKLRAGARARLAARQEPATRLIAALQMLGRRPPALALVQPGSTRDLVHVRAVLSSMLPWIQQRTQALRAELALNQQLRNDAELALSAVDSSQKRLAVERASLVRLAAQHRIASKRLSGIAINEQDRAVALGEKARDIVDLMQDIDAAAEVRTALETLPGPLLRPLSPTAPRAAPVELVPLAKRRLSYRLPVTGTVVTGLGEVSSAGVRARGLTIATRSGALVVAPASGRVMFAAPYRGYGKIVIIDHGKGWTTLITSIAALDTATGENVIQGSPIGRAGNDQPTVTVELREAGRPVDITPMLN